MSKLEQLREKKAAMLLGGGEKRIQAQHDRGKKTARERLDLLFDEGTFVELETFVAHRCTNFDMAEKELASEGVVVGYGMVDGRLVFAFSQDFTVAGGSLGEMHAYKIVQVQEMALKMGAPCVGINDSGGARVEEGVAALSGYARIFKNNTICSGVIPQISVILGPCAGGAVYSPAITDFIFMVDKTSQMFITGPAVIKTVTGEDVTAEELGGAKTNLGKSGNAHFVGATEEETLEAVKKILGYFPSNNMEMPPVYECTDDPNRSCPELETIIPDNPNKAYDMYEIIKSLADNGEIFDISSTFARNIITCFIRMNGQSVGVIANQPKVGAGCLDIDASDKAARFIRRCDAYNIPMLTICDVPGFLPGVGQEYGGIIRHGAKMLYAYSEATVPMVTLITRKAYGGAYVAMCNKDLGSDVNLAWPTAQVAVMGASGAVNIISSIKKEIKAAADPVGMTKEKVAEYEENFNNPYVAAKLGYVDDVIEPAQSRQRITSAFDMLASKRVSLPAKKHGNIPL